ncbi:hypothetical protein CIB48_g2682 [Xylaria polymorpha]|nr:hypothetical protein CIB48_g2682 [Xylaria polymorpha]
MEGCSFESYARLLLEIWRSIASNMDIIIELLFHHLNRPLVQDSSPAPVPLHIRRGRTRRHKGLPTQQFHGNDGFVHRCRYFHGSRIRRRWNHSPPELLRPKPGAEILVSCGSRPWVVETTQEQPEPQSQLVPARPATYEFYYYCQFRMEKGRPYLLW